MGWEDGRGPRRRREDLYPEKNEGEEEEEERIPTRRRMKIMTITTMDKQSGICTVITQTTWISFCTFAFSQRNNGILFLSFYCALFSWVSIRSSRGSRSESSSFGILRSRFGSSPSRTSLFPLSLHFTPRNSHLHAPG